MVYSTGLGLQSMDDAGSVLYHKHSKDLTYTKFSFVMLAPGRVILVSVSAMYLKMLRHEAPMMFLSFLTMNFFCQYPQMYGATTLSITGKNFDTQQNIFFYCQVSFALFSAIMLSVVINYRRGKCRYEVTF